MKLFLIRHCERDMSPLYKSSLTKKGKNDALNLCINLNKNNIKKIYTSPYLRCIQTIHEYCKLFNVELNVENGVSETNLMLIEDEIQSVLDEFNICNLKYKSKVSIDTLNNTNNDIHDIIKRVGNLIMEIIEDNKDYNNNILICTHSTIINVILYLFDIISYRDVIADKIQPPGTLIEIV